MQRVEIARGGGFALISIGNGWAYELGCNGASGTIFVQGDDATQFREEWDALEQAKPDTHTTALLREMWDRYAEIAS
jgi:hypothetical protein